MRHIENNPSVQLNHCSTDMLIWILFWINQFIDLVEIRQKIVCHNKNEGLIITTMLERSHYFLVSKSLRYILNMERQDYSISGE
jgi:hypothetical protein